MFGVQAFFEAYSRTSDWVIFIDWVTFRARFIAKIKEMSTSVIIKVGVKDFTEI